METSQERKGYQIRIDLLKITDAFCKENRHGIIEIHVKNHEIQGVKKNPMEYVKLPLQQRRTD